MFKIDKERQLILPLLYNLTFLFNVTFLSHCQSYTTITDKNSPRFYNISSYANEKLLNCLRTSFKIIVNSNKD